MSACCTVASFCQAAKSGHLSIHHGCQFEFVTDTIKCCIHVCGDGKGHQIQPRSVEHNFRHNAVVLRVTLKSIILKFSSIIYLTLANGLSPAEHPRLILVS